MTTHLPTLAQSYVDAVNRHDAAAFAALFADDAIVDDNYREFRGVQAIRQWRDREIFAAHVTLEVLSTGVRDGQTLITTKVDGNFDRTGLPDPVIIDHVIRAEGQKIASLTCRLAVPTGA